MFGSPGLGTLERSIPCRLLVEQKGFPLHHLVLANPSLQLHAFSGSQLRNPDITTGDFGLPHANFKMPTLISVDIFKDLWRLDSQAASECWDRIKRLSTAVVGLDSVPSIRLGAPPAMLQACDVVIKGQGLYRDRRLYNADVGPMFEGGNWYGTASPSEWIYDDQQLDKLRLGPPCFASILPQVRRWIRRHANRDTVGVRVSRAAGDWFSDHAVRAARYCVPRTKGIHFVGALTHVQRIDAIELLKRESVSGTLGITAIPDWIFGTRAYTSPISAEVREEMETRVARCGGLHRRKPRPRFLAELLAHRAGLGITGYGELTFRHGEILASGTPLIAQDLSGIETTFPFAGGENVVYVKPDLSDLVDHARAALRGEYSEIGARGRRDWTQWASDPRAILDRDITRHILETMA